MRGRSRRTPSHPGKPGPGHTELLSTVHGGCSPDTGGQLGHMINEARRESGQHRGLQARQIGLQTQTLPSNSCVSLSKVSISSSLGFLTC